MATQRQTNKHYARCSIGIGRWYWIVWPAEVTLDDRHPPLAFGYARSAAEADERVRLNYPKAVRRPATFAKRWHSSSGSSGAERRQPNKTPFGKRAPTKPVANKPPPSAEPEPILFLYTDQEDEYDGFERSVAHTVVRQTKRHLIIRTGKGRTQRLDRSQLERTGKARGSDWSEIYYTTPIEVRRPNRPQPRWAVILGVDCRASRAEIKLAYRRRVLQTHPDRGGNVRDFKQVQAAWESIQERLG